MTVYLDYNATTPVDSEVQKTICSVLQNEWGNPSSSYDLGKKAKTMVDLARFQVGEMVSCLPCEIIFTSGGTESNNMVIHTALKYFHERMQNSASDAKDEKPHIITTNIEHDSIRLPLEKLSSEGKIDVTFVPVSKVTGAVEVDDILNAVRPSTCLVTVMLANNETGVIQPVNLLRRKLKSLQSTKNSFINQILLHTDAAQAIGKIKVDVFHWDVDYLTIVGHKFYGPRVGALYFKKGVPLYPMFYGGGQEKNYRAGTENTCMLAGLGKAAELVTFNSESYYNHMNEMSQYLEHCLTEKFSTNVVFHLKNNKNKLPNTVSVAFNYPNISGKTILREAKKKFVLALELLVIQGKNHLLFY
ncbi:selenocysteine lyase [Caerostris extrusa]|uniref:Selenocysteine lyase n=1 Tax=Caerostris extrusa TaxID=172846 RepID=A0AAV4XXZ0_CAEEX|nr:selenocysteine lyase [Caerostris extrusa]